MTNDERDKYITETTGRTARQDLALSDVLIEKMAEQLDGQPNYIVLMAVTRLLARISMALNLPKDEALHLISMAPDWLLVSDVEALLRMIDDVAAAQAQEDERTVFDRKDED